MTCVPLTVTNRKWNTRSIVEGRGAEPQALPWVLEEYDQPIAYWSIELQWLTGASLPPPPPVT